MCRGLFGLQVEFPVCVYGARPCQEACCGKCSQGPVPGIVAQTLLNAVLFVIKRTFLCLTLPCGVEDRRYDKDNGVSDEVNRSLLGYVTRTRWCLRWLETETPESQAGDASAQLWDEASLSGFETWRCCNGQSSRIKSPRVGCSVCSSSHRSANLAAYQSTSLIIICHHSLSFERAKQAKSKEIKTLAQVKVVE